MPNWCENLMTIEGITNSKKAHNLIKNLQDNKFFDYIVPRPSFSDNEEENRNNFGYKDWYDWSLAKWGCKWDADVFTNTFDETIGVITIGFNTPWGPPNEHLLMALAKYFNLKNTDIYNYYYEPGNAFVGKQEVIDGIFTEFSYDIPHFDCQSNENIRDFFLSALGADIVDTFALDENMIENCADTSWWDL